MKVGTRVRFVGDETYTTYKSSGFYPPIGTLGTVKDTDVGRKGKEQIFVAWDSGTIGNGIWWCYESDVEVVDEGEGVNMFVIIYDGCPKAIVETEADAQELVADLNQEFAHEQFNWIMQSSFATIQRAMALTEFNLYKYKKVPKI